MLAFWSHQRAPWQEEAPWTAMFPTGPGSHPRTQMSSKCSDAAKRLIFSIFTLRFDQSIVDLSCVRHHLTATCASLLIIILIATLQHTLVYSLCWCCLYEWHHCPVGNLSTSVQQEHLEHPDHRYHQPKSPWSGTLVLKMPRSRGLNGQKQWQQSATVILIYI